MKLYYMKKEALDILKSNIDITYNKYFIERDNKWLWKICDGNPFVEYKEIPDFDLTPIEDDISKGEIEFNNCKILYENLKFLTESQACDERLWAGLCHSVFYDYIRKRYDYDKTKPKTAKLAISNIKSRFFFSGGTRSGLYRNSISKCWWVGHNVYDGSNITNPFIKLDIIGSNDISTKISDIFFSNNFSANPTILNGIVMAFKNFKDENINLNFREHMRPSLQLLNAIGGNVILDCLNEEEIADILIDNIYAILQGDSQSIDIDDSENGDLIEEMNEKINEEIYISVGQKVKILDIDSKEEKIIKVDFLDTSSKIPPLAKFLIGKTEGEIIEFNNRKYEIITILN